MLQKIKRILFQNRDNRQTVAKNVFWLTVGQVGSRLIRSVIIIYAARALGAADYGVFSYLMGIAGFFTIFTDIGIGSVMTREVAKRPQERSYYFSTGFWIKIFLSAIVFALIVFVFPLFSKIEAAKDLLWIIAILVVFDGLRDFTLSFFQAAEKMEWSAIITFTTNILITILGFLALHFLPTAKNLTTFYAIAVVLGAAVAVFVLRREFLKVFSHYKKELIGPIIESALPIAFLSAIGAFMLNTDFVLLGWWQSAESIGYYSAGQKIVQFLYVVPASLATAIFPQISRLVGEDNKVKIRNLMEKALSIIFMFAIPMMVGGIVLAKSIVNLIYGSAYLPGVLNFQFLLVTLIIAFPGTMIGNWAVAFNKQKRIAKYLLVSSIANALFDVIFIPRLGFIGSTYATIIALSINTFLVWRLLKSINNFYTFRFLRKIIFASLFMGLTSFILNLAGANLILNIAISALIYFSVLYVLKEQSIEEMKILARNIRGA